MVTDRSLVLRKLAELDRHRDELREYETLAVESYQSDWKVQRIVERTLQMCIEICGDVANHIVAEEGLRVPTSMADAFRSLREGRVLPAEMVPDLVSMTRFRNVVVHQYDEVDPVIVVGILRRHLGDFEAFRNAIVGFLARQDGR